MSTIHRTPAAWQRRRWVLWASGPMFSVFAVLGLLAVPQQPLIGLCVTVVALSLAVPGFLLMQELRGGVGGMRSTSGAAPGLEFPSSVPRALVVLASIVVYVAIFVVFVVAVAVGADADPLAATLVTSGVVLAFVVAMLLVLARRGTLVRPGVPAVLLTRDALVVRGLVSRTVLGWEELPYVLPHRALRLDVRTARGVPGRRRGQHASLPGGLYRSSRLAIAAAIEYYSRHEHVRHELGTVVAEERVRREDLPAAFA